MARKVYTDEFDRVVDAGSLDTVLGPLLPMGRAALDEAWYELQTGLLPWKTRLLIAAAEAQVEIRRTVPREELRDTIVSLLIDHSGSMRGQKILFAAATAELVLEILRTLGVACEILGFTTVAWRGGRSRERWLHNRRPASPGRLNDLLHIVYNSAIASGPTATAYDFKPMLRPDLLKENIDGEALEWAAERLRQARQRRKIIVAISDGVPVDDATLSANGLSFLSDHLKHVIAEIGAAADIELMGVTIGSEGGRYYPDLTRIELPSELGRAVLDRLTAALSQRAA